MKKQLRSVYILVEHKSFYLPIDVTMYRKFDRIEMYGHRSLIYAIVFYVPVNRLNNKNNDANNWMSSRKSKRKMPNVWPSKDNNAWISVVVSIQIHFSRINQTLAKKLWNFLSKPKKSNTNRSEKTKLTRILSLLLLLLLCLLKRNGFFFVITVNIFCCYFE